MKVTSDYMRSWGRHTHGSPLYAVLTETIASSDDLLRVINRIPHEPPPNVLFAAVQFLLMEDGSHSLASFYPSLVDAADAPEDAPGPFTQFVLDHEDEIVGIGNTRFTQTNECRRCVALLPAIWHSGFDSFHLIDIGTSAGLNLGLDLYAYDWGRVQWGTSSLLLATESRGRDPEPRDFEIRSRFGLDLNPVDASVPEERRWLEALIWPEHADRRTRLQAALDMSLTYEKTMVAGSALDTLPEILDGLAADESAVVMHSFALNQFTSGQREALDAILAEGRKRRSVHRVSYEFIDKEDAWTRLAVDGGQGLTEIGRGHPHGEWVELYARP